MGPRTCGGLRASADELTFEVFYIF